MISLIVAYGLGFVTAMALFIWVNRKNPSALDAAEDVVRK